jgi:membrane-bound metal-dependent hydrolase YbcI (DUF457 family)
MQAINHAAAALILKRKFPSTPLLGLILATEAVEYLWVVLNLIGIEQTIIADPMRSVADVHLAHMPFSHSVGTSVIIAGLVGLFVLWRGGKARSAIAVALSLAVFSHIVLDLLVHARDIAIVPFLGAEKYGTGLYSNLPVMALGLETLFGVFCWWVYRGSWQLLALIIALALTSIPLYSTAINVGEVALSGQSNVFAMVILMQMLVTSGLLWFFARETPSFRDRVLEKNSSRKAAT